MKKFIIGILSILGYVGVKKIAKREILNYALRRYISINAQLNVTPAVSREALQAMLKDVKERREYHQKKLVETGFLKDPRKLANYMEWLYREQVNIIRAREAEGVETVRAGDGTVLKKFFNSAPGEGGPASLGDSIAQGAINFVNKEAAKTGKPQITQEDVAKTQEELRKRGMIS